VGSGIFSLRLCVCPNERRALPTARLEDGKRKEENKEEREGETVNRLTFLWRSFTVKRMPTLSGIFSFLYENLCPTKETASLHKSPNGFLQI
jgi:hypothetical protein